MKACGLRRPFLPSSFILPPSSFILRFVYFLYSLLLLVGFLVLLPRFALDAARHGKYAAGFRQRLGNVPRVEAGGRPVVWLHCVSVGETRAARPVAVGLLAANPGCVLVVSTTTLTGQRLARELFGDVAAEVFYFPFDFRFAVRRALARVRPSLVLIMETELWAHFLRECRRAGVPVALVNGRISPKSARNYRRIRFFMRGVANDLSLALMQSDADAARLIDIGIEPRRVLVTGNVKFDSGEIVPDEMTRELDRRFRFTDSARPLVVCASTHDGEEDLLLRAFERLREKEPHLRPRLLIAPRHPERFDAAGRVIRSHGFTSARRSEPPAQTDAECDAVLLDSIGELLSVYTFARVVFVGGSLVPHGGHNILEPAAANRAIVTGAHTLNFDLIVRTFLDADALIQVPASDDAKTIEDLACAFHSLLTDAELNRSTADRAMEVCRRNRGATGRTIEAVTRLLPKSQPASSLPRLADSLQAVDRTPVADARR